VAEKSYYDAIVSVNVIEHIKNDVDELIKYKELLNKSNGHLCIFTPACPELHSLIDSDFGHYRRYTIKSMSNALERAGFKIIKIYYFNFIGYFAWFLNFKILRSRSFNPKMVRLYDRYIFRYFFKIEKKFRPPFGQSIIAIAKA